MAAFLFRSVTLLVLFSSQGALARRSMNEVLESSLESSGAEELGTNTDHNCCYRLLNGETPCGCEDAETDYFKGVCLSLKSKRNVFTEDSRVCSEFAGPFTAKAAECYLEKEKCVKCSASSILKKCGMAKEAALAIAKPCSSLDREQKDKLCDFLADKSKTTPDGLYWTSSIISAALMKEKAPYTCSPAEIEGMCGVAPLCPEFVANIKYTSIMCDALKSRKKVDGGKRVFDGDRASQELQKAGITCSSRDVYAVCGVAQPYQSPCPNFEDMSALVANYCKNIKRGTMVEGKPLDYSLASKFLAKEKSITCSAGDIAKICDRNSRAKH